MNGQGKAMLFLAILLGQFVNNRNQVEAMSFENIGKSVANHQDITTTNYLLREQRALWLAATVMSWTLRQIPSTGSFSTSDMAASIANTTQTNSTCLEALTGTPTSFSFSHLLWNCFELNPI